MRLPSSIPAPPAPPGPSGEMSPEWEQARQRLKKKRKFFGDLVSYVVINLALVGIWFFAGQGYFWPGWVMAGWGVFLALDGWDTYLRRPITDDDIEKEIREAQKRR